MRYRLAAALLSAALLFGSGGQSRADAVAVGERELQLTPPPGFCVARQDEANDASVFAAYQDFPVRDALEVLSLWVDCAALDAYRAGTVATPLPYVMVAALKENGHVEPIDQPRRRYVEDLSKQVAATAGLPAPIDGDFATIDQALVGAATKLGDPAKLNFASRAQYGLNLIAREDDTEYYATIKPAARNQSGRDEPRFLAMLTATTAIDGIALSLRVVEDDRAASTFATAHLQARSAVDALVAANGGADAVETVPEESLNFMEEHDPHLRFLHGFRSTFWWVSIAFGAIFAFRWISRRRRNS